MFNKNKKQMKGAIFTPFLLFVLLLGVANSLQCQQGQVVINGVCATNDVSVPPQANTSYQGSQRMTLKIAQTQGDPNSLDILFIVTTIDEFYIVFGDTYINSDAVQFELSSDEDNPVIVTAIDSFYQQPFPQKPVSDVSLGGTQDIVLLGYLANNSDPNNPTLLVKIRRKYNTQDQYDTLFQSNQIQLNRVLFGIPKVAKDPRDQWYTGSFFFVLNAATQPCQNNQIFNGKTCVQNDLTPIGDPYIAYNHANPFLFISHQTTQGGDITFLVRCLTNGYFGIGWGSNLMSNMDMHIFNVNIDNPNFPIVIVDDSFSSGPGSPKYDTMLGGTYDITVLGYLVEQNQVTVKYVRKMANQDVNNDFQFQYNQEIPFAYALSPADAFSLTLIYHKFNIGWGTLVLQASDAQPCAAVNKVYINTQCLDNNLSTTGLDQKANYNAGLLNVQYGIVNDDTIEFVFTINNIGWFGFGFSLQQPDDNWKKDMTNVDIIIFDTITLQDESLAIYIQDTFANKNIVPNLDISLKGTSDYNLLGYSINKQTQQTQVKVSRKINTGDKYDYQFVKNSKVGIIYAWMNTVDNIQFHGKNTGNGILNFYYNPKSCPTGQVLIGENCVTNDIKPLSSYAQDNFLNVQFDLAIEGSVTFMIVVQNTGWFGFGFGQGMNNVDMIVAENDSGVVTLSDNYSQKEATPSSDTNLGGQNNLNLLGYELTDKQLTFKFSRKLDTGDKYDYVLQKDQMLNIVYAWGSDGSMTYHHQNIALAKFPLQQGYRGTITGIAIDDTYKQFHFWSNFVLWGFVVDVAFVIARFFKTGRFYKEIHGAMMGIIVVFTAFVEIWMITKKDILFNGQLDTKDQMNRAHAVMGFIFLIFFILEAVGGSFLNFLLSFKNTGDATSLKIKSFHKYFGYLLYVIGKINVFLGVRMVENDAQQTACISGYTIFIVLRLILEYLYRKQPKIFVKILFLSAVDDESSDTLSSTNSLLTTKEGYANLVDMINSAKTTSEIISTYPNMNYVIYKDNIYSLDKISHPGGKFIFNSVRGRDVSRFMNGSYGLENTNMPPHTHSLYATQLLKQNQIGVLSQPNILSESSGSHHVWRVSKEKYLSKSTALFQFESLNRIKVQNAQKGMEWMGRHYTLSDLANEKSTRIYTNCLCFTPYNILLMQKMKQNYSQLIQEPQSTIDSTLPQESNVLPLVIKRYESPTGLSQYIHDETSNQAQSLEMLVEGPLGRGLELSSKSSGLHLFVAGGTGILPFYDLLTYYCKYLMFKAIQKKHGEQVAKFFDIANDNFARFISQDFKIKVIAAFNSSDDDCGAIQLLEFMKQIDLDNNLNLFDAVLSVKGYHSRNITMDNQHFTQEYFEKHLGNLIVNRAYVCGPPGLNRNAPDALQKIGLSSMQITIV
ncbi:DOMON domain protein (macronuclear) [Tetrahymena thermophila SB210]|uniref:DOMON domain protein n=1 Tax=Tetrahymena thermophila (strain SB210) TaxID=312017 RepID=I7LTL1_TETTS|nr:DOMON domain protein [Tetrahymena thermophila SB210]EAR85450.2 DOMON domain protein [Tetrahymena thermophila SB210]|eukprot:XP_001033113.2 DOMON domain protein [Tetrahymena thermophila SB210]